MARPSYNIPEPRIVIVQEPGSADNQYEVYLIKPIRLGSITDLGWMNYGTDDGHAGFTKMEAAVRHLLSTRGYDDLAKRAELRFSGQSSGSRKKSKKLAPIVGQVLLERGVWYEFCKMRNIAQGDVKALSTLYDLSVAERKRWGLPGGDEE